MNEHLSRLGVPHLVLERNRIAEAWRSGRWDSLVANGPAWHDRFPGMEFDIDPDGFPGKDQVAAYFEPTRRNSTRRSVPASRGCAIRPRRLHRGNLRRDHRGQPRGRRHWPVPASGDPADAPRDERIRQIHSAHYYNPQQLPEGAVLVVGAVRRGTDRRRAATCRAPGRWALMTVRRVPTATATSAGGWACSANGMRKSPGARACDHRRERCPRRTYRGLPRPGASGRDPGRTDRILRRRRRAWPDLAENLARGDGTTWRCSTPPTPIAAA